MENGVEYKIRQIRSNGRGAMYWPFRPSYATTFHKVQGMTLRNVFIDTHHSMMDGMFYVGSSRVRSAEGLHIVGPTPTYIRYNRKVLEEQRKIEAASIIPLV
ncbi:hypothetical protein GCK72_016067 [Caenorhabditis remanei]|uniref:UvrD-like helicase C-terminal domain-containing protein n=1 Tax=Caenorhabditis remanei TaxID=31234 RepID=A0A6A5GUB1_CAERE|nr:hypothetical protein GCK72_015237 [Caenorhabditis remanei]XP_053586073.1 hypothetical protein GCK72_016067 [Caenorhabditis remanei]KAF1758777.1 hypothetical protein GCK72_015237 [Caenorhabditis remanei]KAF1759600.1 hypothetical protein GCK72_016067 [Caenorhabditis remanei]